MVRTRGGSATGVAAGAGARAGAAVDVEALRRDNARLRQEMEAIDTINVDGGKVAFANCPSNEKARITAAVQKSFWPTMKFVPKSDAGRAAVIKHVVNNLEPPLPGNAAIRRAYRAKYGNVVIKCINNVRNYVMGEIRDETKAALEEGVTLPTVELLEKCLKRTIDPENEAEMAAFVYYWDRILPKATGQKHIWSEEHRWFHTISEAAPLNAPNSPYITPSIEAFAVLEYDNKITMWRECREAKLKFPTGRLTHTLIDEEDPQRQCVLEGKKIMLRAPKFRAKWTVKDGGSDGTIGWNNEGLMRYETLLTYAKQGRASVRCLDVERAVMTAVREENGVSAMTWSDHKGGRRKRRRTEEPIDNGPNLLIDIPLDDDSGDEED